MTTTGAVLLASVVVLTGVLLVGFPLADQVSVELACYWAPMIAVLVAFVVFCALLMRQTEGNLTADLGFFYMALGVAYTVIPALSFIVIGLDEGNPLAQFISQLLPVPSELGNHLWRHVIFVVAVGTGYLLVRGNQKIPQITIADTRQADGPTILFIMGVIFVSLVFLTVLSAPVESYYDNYTRYDHLSPLLRRFASIFIRLSFGFYTILLVFLFLNYRKYRLLIPIVVITICVYETIHSVGSRIYAFVILVETAWLYHVTVTHITVKRWIMFFALLVCVFTAVEIVRPLENNQTSDTESLFEQGVKAPGELGAVFLTSFRLYEDRARGALPETEWPMFFNDFISLVTFSDFTRWNPEYWYARNYFPEALFPPNTLGPIADSAIWGGELDLLLRGLANGAFFAYLMRWFLRRTHTWWALTVYIYCYASAVMTLKYSVFYILTPLVKTVLPALVVVAAFRRVLFSIGNSGNRSRYTVASAS